MHLPVSRRGALALMAAGGLVATGCDAGDLDPRSEPPTPTVTETLQAPAPADEQADAETLARVLAETSAALALVQAVTARHPSLRGRLTPLARMHRTHRDLLARAAAEEDEATPPSVTVPRRRAAALRLVGSHEDVARKRYEGWALDARSGTFARLLASMAAGVAQHTVALSETSR